MGEWQNLGGDNEAEVFRPGTRAALDKWDVEIDKRFQLGGDAGRLAQFGVVTTPQAVESGTPQAQPEEGSTDEWMQRVTSAIAPASSRLKSSVFPSSLR